MVMKAVRLALIALLVTLGFTSALAQGGYRIDSWKELIDLHKDSSYEVTETLGVTFEEARHGIYRIIPTASDDGRGFNRQIYLSDITVADEQGNAYTTKITWSSGNCTIRVGDADNNFRLRHAVGAAASNSTPAFGPVSGSWSR